MRGLSAVRGRHLFVADLVVIALAIVGSMLLRFDSLRFTELALIFFPAALFPLLIRPPVNVLGGLYSRAWAYASVGELVRIFLVVVAGSLIGLAFFYLFLMPAGVHGTITDTGSFPRSFFVLEGLLTLVGMGGLRFLIRAGQEWGGWRPGSREDADTHVPTLIYGAGNAGATTLRTIAAAPDGLGMHVVGLLDDDRRKRNLVVRGEKVLGDISELAEIARATGARRLLVAIPSAPGDVIRRAVEHATELGLETRTVPALEDLVSGRMGLNAIREVRVEDLLRREAVLIDEPALRDLIRGRTVMVTGAGGSIGSELARQVFDLDPGTLVLLDRAEGPLYDIERELTLLAERDSETATRSHKRAQLVTRLANVVSEDAMRQVVAEDRPVMILHAAAYKHVPMMEQHPADAVVTNLGGTLSVLRAATGCGVERVVLVSTDKAVAPTSVMGASKRLAELAVEAAAVQSGCRWVVVRFGNVLGSSGSVVPLFQRQLAEGVPLTITDPEMTRYFMTIPEAARLILQASLFGEAGDLFVLDMGDPVRIVDLARDLARLAGRDPDSVPIRYIGLRPGEKLHESLFYGSEQVEPTGHPKVLRARREATAQPAVLEALDELVSVGLAGDHERARVALFETLARVDAGVAAHA